MIDTNSKTENYRLLGGVKSPTSWSNPETYLVKNPNGELPSFPTHLLGEFFSDWCLSTANSANAPVDYVGASLLALTGSLIGNSRVAKLADWEEPPIYWVLLIGPPSSGKTPALDPFVQILAALERAECIRLSLDDATAAAAAELAGQSPRGLFLLNDELSAWLSTMSKYGGEQFWIKAYGAKAHTVDRKGAPPIRIERLAISVLGGAQPDTIAAITNAKINRGFAARWLYVNAKPLADFRLPVRTNHVLAQDALHRLLKLNPAPSGPSPVVVSSQCKGEFEKWIGEKRKEASRHQSEWGEWLGKQSGTAMRLALILEYLWWAAESPLNSLPPKYISPQAVAAAFEFIDTYAAPMAKFSLSASTLPREDRAGVRLVQLLRNSGTSHFNAREVRRGGLGPAGDLANAATMQQACELLEQAHLIRHVGIRAGSSTGRAPTTYEINPRLFD